MADEGDRALVELTRRFDGAEVEGRLQVRAEEIHTARISSQVERALRAMAERLRRLHARQLPEAWEATADGVTFGEVLRPVGSVGCYVPGGRAAYPSTVLMTVVPAKVAGVPRVAVCTPPRADGSIPAEVLVATAIAGADEVYRVGGAQAVAALAYGTETIRAVDTIVGPGNAWVTAAKREVAGLVGIDGLAGPTELVVVADETADPDVVAADLVAQAEHDPGARAVLVALDAALPPRVDAALRIEVERSPRREVVEAALKEAAALVAGDLEEAARLVDGFAPEHLQIAMARPRELLERAQSFGAAFVGTETPVAFGDYGIGSNHVLPTMGTARFASGLRAADFVRVCAYVQASPEAAAGIGADAESVALAEGLPGHARAVEVRR